MPLGGKYQLSPAAGMAAKLPVTKGETDTATIMSIRIRSCSSLSASPFHGALYAVIDSVTKIAAMGGDYRKIRLTFQEYFEKLGEDPARWGKPMAALLGALRVQQELEIPAIGGKDSMSGTFMDIDVPPTLASFAITAVDADDIISHRVQGRRQHTRGACDMHRQAKTAVLDFDIYRSNMAEDQRTWQQQARYWQLTRWGAAALYMTLVKMAVGNRYRGRCQRLLQTCWRRCYGSMLILEIPGMRERKRD